MLWMPRASSTELAAKVPRTVSRNFAALASLGYFVLCAAMSASLVSWFLPGDERHPARIDIRPKILSSANVAPLPTAHVGATCDHGLNRRSLAFVPTAVNFIDDTTAARRVRLPPQTSDGTPVGERPGRAEYSSARRADAGSPLLPALAGYHDPELIAHGTTALVFRATQTRLNRQVAIKVLTVDDESVWANAEKELAITVTLSGHPHIVSIIDTGLTEDHRPYIVMEYCEGGSYAQIFREGGPVAVADVIDVGIKIGEALAAAHHVGIVHRDVKPANILRSRFGAALTDFGIARASDELNATLTLEMMTPNYASPEALLHKAQSGLSDVYSLAATMWTLLVGDSPFANKSNKDLGSFC